MPLSKDLGSIMMNLTAHTTNRLLELKERHALYILRNWNLVGPSAGKYVYGPI